jgi:ATP-binding cassette subfamily B protein
MQIQSSLEELSLGRTVIVVAHRLSTVKRADEIVVIGKEGIVERGTHEELIALDGEYKKLYDYQFRDAK